MVLQHLSNTRSKKQHAVNDPSLTLEDISLYVTTIICTASSFNKSHIQTKNSQVVVVLNNSPYKQGFGGFHFTAVVPQPGWLPVSV